MFNKLEETKKDMSFLQTKSSNPKSSQIRTSGKNS